MKLILTFILLASLYSCNDITKSQSNLDLSDNNAIVVDSAEMAIKGNLIQDTTNFNSTKYIFVVLKVSHTEMGQKMSYNTVSDIIEVPAYSITEDFKYKSMDEISNAYLNSLNAKVYKGAIKSRKFLEFDSYAEASKEREKYITD